MNAGYILIDCKGLELTSQNTQTITGIYDRVTQAIQTGKPIIAGNCQWENDVMTPISVMVTPRSSGNYIATASTLQMEIDPNDGVTIINMLAG